MTPSQGRPSRPAKRGRDAEEEEPEGQQAKRGRVVGPQDLPGPATTTRGLDRESQDWEDEADAALPDFAGPAVTDVRSREFALDVEELSRELYGDDDAPVPLREVIGLLVEEGWSQDVPLDLLAAPPAQAGSPEDLAGSAWAGPAAALVLEPRVLGDDVVYAGPGGRVAEMHWEVAARYARLLGRVNPLRDSGGEFATNCVLTAIAVDLTLAEGAGFQAGAAGLLEVADVERYAGRSLAGMDGYGDVAGAVRAAGPGARGVVLVRARGQEHDHAISVVHDEGRVVFLDGQAGRLAMLPEDPAMVRLVLTAVDDVAGEPRPVTVGEHDATTPRRLIQWNQGPPRGR